MMRFVYLTFIVTAAMVAALYTGPDGAQAHWAPGGSYWTITVNEDRFMNWDFRSEDPYYWNVDWPVTHLFYDNAWINKVKDKLKNVVVGCSGGGMHARIDEGGGWQWDGDGGIKDVCGCPDGVTSSHLRVYADGDDMLYNMSLGYYVIGSAHLEDNHRHYYTPLFWTCEHHWVGYNNDAQSWWDGYSDQVAGWAFPYGRNSAILWNDGILNDFHDGGESHHVRSDGYGTYIEVP